MEIEFGQPEASSSCAEQAADGAWLRSARTTVTVNQRALVEKILARYAVDFFLLKELIQNADDAQASSVHVDLTTATDLTAAERLAGAQRFSALSVTNRGGQLFDESGWERIVEIATGNPDEHSVGHFGVGFYSVFAASECPRIQSGRRVMELSWDGNDIAVRRTVAQDVGGTVVSLPLKLEAEARQWELGRLQQFLARALCFPKHIRELTLSVDAVSVAEFTRQQQPDADLLHPSQDTGLRFESQRGYFWVTQVSQRWVAVTCGGHRWAGQLVSVEMEQRKERGDELRKLNSGIAGVIGKQPLQRPEVHLLYDDMNDVDHAGDLLFRSISPTEASGIFVGFDTGLTAGAGFHTCGSFLPTMERTNLDMTHPQIQIWNQELLAVAGAAARICYDQAMSAVECQLSTGDSDADVTEQVASSWWSMRALRQLEQRVSAGDEGDEAGTATSGFEAEEASARAIATELMSAHQFRPDGGPHAHAISQCIGFAFWRFRPAGSIRVLTNKGIWSAERVFRVPSQLSGIEDFISSACMTAENAQRLPDFVKRAGSSLKELSVAHVTKLLGEQSPLSARRTIQLMRWFSGVRPSTTGGNNRSGAAAGAAAVHKRHAMAERKFRDLIARYSPNDGAMLIGELMGKFTQSEPLLKKQIFVGEHKRASKWFQDSSAFQVRGPPDRLMVSITPGKGTAGANRVTLSVLANVEILVLLGPLDDPKRELQRFASFTHFPRESIRGTPTPLEVLPLCIAHHFSVVELQTVFELQPVDTTVWFDHFRQHLVQYCEPKTCSLFLKAVASNIPALSATLRSDFTDKLQQMPCIPCEQKESVGDYGQSRRTIKMYRPGETYLLSPEHRLKFQGWNLPRPDLPDFEADFLISIGVRTEPHVTMVLDNAVQQRWSLLQVIDYLAANQEDIANNDWTKCKELVVRNWFRGLSVKYLDNRVSRLMLPGADCLNMEPITPTRKQVMLQVGFNEWPELQVLLGLDTSNVGVQQALSEYLFDSWEAQYNSESNRLALARSCLLCIPTTDAEDAYSDVSNCFILPQPFGLKQVHPSVRSSVARLIGVQDHPPMDTVLDMARDYCELFRSLVASPDHYADVSKMVEVLAYFQTRTAEFTNDHFETTKSLTWVYTAREKLVCAADAYIRSDKLVALYGSHILEFADERYSESPAAVAFLRACGMQSRPTAVQFATAMTTHHARIPTAQTVVKLLKRLFEEIMQVEGRNELLEVLKPVKMFPGKRNGKLARGLTVGEICINDNPDFVRKLETKLTIAPPEIESSLRAMGSRPVSERVQTSYLLGKVKEYTIKAESLRVVLVNRGPIIVHEPDGITEGMVAAGALERREGLRDHVNLKYLHLMCLVECETIKQVHKFDGAPCPELPAVDADCAFVDSPSPTIYITSTCTEDEFARTLALAIFLDASAQDISLCEKLLFGTEKNLKKLYQGIEFMLLDQKYGPTGRAALKIQAAVRRWIAMRRFQAAVLLQRAFRKHLQNKNAARLQQHRYFVLNKVAAKDPDGSDRQACSDSSSCLLLQPSEQQTMDQDDEGVIFAKEKGCWLELTDSEKKAAETLGWSAASWDAGQSPQSTSVGWAHLEAAQQAAAQKLGYDRFEWDEELFTRGSGAASSQISDDGTESNISSLASEEYTFDRRRRAPNAGSDDDGQSSVCSAGSLASDTTTSGSDYSCSTYDSHLTRSESEFSAMTFDSRDTHSANQTSAGATPRKSADATGSSQMKTLADECGRRSGSTSSDADTHHSVLGDERPEVLGLASASHTTRDDVSLEVPENYNDLRKEILGCDASSGPQPMSTTESSAKYDAYSSREEHWPRPKIDDPQILAGPTFSGVTMSSLDGDYRADRIRPEGHPYPYRSIQFEPSQVDQRYHDHTRQDFADEPAPAQPPSSAMRRFPNRAPENDELVDEVTDMEQRYFEAAMVLRDALASKERELASEQEHRAAVEQELAAFKASSKLTECTLNAKIAQLSQSLETAELRIQRAEKLSTEVTQYQRKLESAEAQISTLKDKLSRFQASVQRVQPDVASQFRSMTVAELACLPGPPSPVDTFKTPESTVPSEPIPVEMAGAVSADVRDEALFIRSLKQLVLEGACATPFDVGKILVQMRKLNQDWSIGNTPFRRFGDFAAAMEEKGHLKLTRGKGGLMVAKTLFMQSEIIIDEVVAALVQTVQQSGEKLASQAMAEVYSSIPGAKEEIVRAGGAKAVRKWSGGRLDFRNVGERSAFFIPNDTDSNIACKPRQTEPGATLLLQQAAKTESEPSSTLAGKHTNRQSVSMEPEDAAILEYIQREAYPAWVRFVASKSLKARNPKLHQAHVRREFWRREVTAKPWLRTVVGGAQGPVCVQCNAGNCKDALPCMARWVHTCQTSGQCTVAIFGNRFRSAHPELLEGLGHQKTGGGVKLALVVRAHPELFVTETLSHGQERLGLTPLGEQLAGARALGATPAELGTQQ